MKLDGVVKDYIKISYQGTDVLYVPATQLDLVSKYIGAGENGAVPAEQAGHGRLGEDEGQSQKIGQGYGGEADQALRRAQTPPGYAFSPDTPWQAEFEENFAYVETDDQLRCIARDQAGYAAVHADGPASVRRRRLW